MIFNAMMGVLASQSEFTPAALDDIIFWLDHTDPAYATYDDYLTNTASSIEDKTGNAYGFVQGNKDLQPLKSARGGITCDAAGKCLQPFSLGPINSLDKISAYFLVTPRSDLYTGSAKRTLLYISEAGSSSAVRFAVYLSGGTSGRKVFAQVSVADGTSHQSSTSSGPQLTNDVATVVGVELDLTGVTAKLEFYTGNVLGFTDTWTPGEAAPWAFHASDSVEIDIGDSGSSPSYCDVDNVVLVGDILTADERLELYEYLGAL